MQRIDAARIEIIPAIANHLGHGGGNRTEHRRSRRHGLQQRQTESFKNGRIDQSRGAGQQRRPEPLINVTRKTIRPLSTVPCNNLPWMRLAKLSPQACRPANTTAPASAPRGDAQAIPARGPHFSVAQWSREPEGKARPGAHPPVGASGPMRRDPRYSRVVPPLAAPAVRRTPKPDGAVASEIGNIHCSTQSAQPGRWYTSQPRPPDGTPA